MDQVVGTIVLIAKGWSCRREVGLQVVLSVHVAKRWICELDLTSASSKEILCQVVGAIVAHVKYFKS